MGPLEGIPKFSRHENIIENRIENRVEEDRAGPSQDGSSQDGSSQDGSSQDGSSPGLCSTSRHHSTKIPTYWAFNTHLSVPDPYKIYGLGDPPPQAYQMSPLQLYRELLRTSTKFSGYNFRQYAIRRTRDGFRSNRDASPAEVEQLMFEGRQQLQMLKRQTAISGFYTVPDLIIETNTA